MVVPAISTGIVPLPQSAVPPLGRGRGLLAMPATTPIWPWTLPTATHPDPRGGTTTARSLSPPQLGPPSSAEQFASVVSDLEAQLRGALGPLVTALPQQQQPRPEQAVGLPRPAIASPEPTVTSKPTLLPGNIAEATRPYWQGWPDDEHSVIPVLMSAYSTNMSAADIQSALNWMWYQRHDMSRYILEWIDRW